MAEATQTEHVSINIRSEDTKLVYSMEKKLHHGSLYTPEKCIYKVPKKLRSNNTKSYDPVIVSIGPYHNGKPELESMEKIKFWYLQNLLLRLPMPPEESTLAKFVKNIRGLQGCARKCYAEKTEFEFDDDRFVEMLILDGCFLVELFRKDAKLIQPPEDDPIFNTPWVHPNLYHDLILLENQIPWFVLLRLFQMSEQAMDLSYTGTDNDVLANLVLKFFKKRMLMTVPAEYRENENQIKHVLDLLHTSLLSSSENTVPQYVRWKHVPTVTDLLQSGVKFMKGSRGDVLNIKFNKGVFEIPPIRIRGNSESLFQNLIAYEECNYFTGHQFTSYAVLLDCLINTSSDVNFLCENGFFEDALSSKEISLFFNRLDNDNLSSQFYYGRLTHNVNKYYKLPRQRFRRTMSKYFKNPWSICSLLAAILVLVLTFTQTLFSILAY